MDDSTNNAFGRRYQLLARIGHGGMGVVYKALDRLTDTTVALKLISSWHDRSHADSQLGEVLAQTVAYGTDVASSVRHSSPDPARYLGTTNLEERRLALAREFRTLASLRHPHIISVLDYGFDRDGRPFYTMELLPHAQTMTTYLRDKSLNDKIDILGQLLSALTYLHRRGVIHRDIKPENALVMPGSDSYQVKLLDFGIAAAREPNQPQNDDVAGTIPYMAPELLRGLLATEQSDLFAVGVMAAEILVGRHPFCSTKIPKDYISAVLWGDPRVQGAGLSNTLEAVLLGLLAKKTEDRFSNANDVTKALFAAVGRQPPIESQEERESFLQAACFIGRRQELALLLDALEYAVDGTGAAFLIGGESGVGKSRLLGELRAHALVRAVLVLRGQAAHDVRTPLLVFREILRELCLHVDLSPLDAGVLKPILPDIERLVGQPVTDPPPLDPKASQERLLGVVEDVLGRADHPMLLLLDDLQWLDSDSLALLSRLVRRIATRRWVLVLSYRDDESPHLPTLFPAARVVPLKRLNPAEIKSLVDSMLGTASSRPDLVDLVARESEGNTFFLVEAVRELALRLGGFQGVSERSLPSKVFSGGIRAAVDRRLARLPSALRPMLQIAAVAGRRLNPVLLAAIVPPLDMGIEAFLHRCEDAAVLDIAEQQWQFSHDKLRERVLEEMSPADLKAAHGLVARAAEQAYPGRDDLAAFLAFHYHEAGRQDLAAPFAARAGELALQSGALQEAVRQLTAALAYHDAHPTDPLIRVRLRRQLVAVYHGLGRLSESVEAAEQAFVALGHPLPKGGLDFFKVLCPRLAEHAKNLALQRLPSPPSPQDLPRIHEVLQLSATAILPLIFVGRVDALLATIFLCLNAAESSGSRDDLVLAYLGMSYFAALLPNQALTKFYEAKATVRLDGCSTKTILLYHRTLGGNHLPHSRWHQAQNAMQQVLKISQQTGDIIEESFALMQLVSMALLTGRSQQAHALCQQIATLSDRIDNGQGKVWAEAIFGFLALQKRHTDHSLTLLDAAVTHASDVHDAFVSIFALGIKAFALLHKGRFFEAEEAADRTLDTIRCTRLVAHAALEGYTAPAETYLTLWRNQGASTAIQHKARLAVTWLNKYARLFAFGSPRAAIWSGTLAVLEGRRRPGFKLIERGIADAAWRGQPRDEAIGRYQLGLALGASDPAAQDHIQRATEIFNHIEDTWRLPSPECIKFADLETLASRPLCRSST